MSVRYRKHLILPTYINLLIEQTQKSKPEKTAEEAAVELAIQAVEAKVRRWEETLGKGAFSA
jgi:hypothetical protein